MSNTTYTPPQQIAFRLVDTGRWQLTVRETQCPAEIVRIAATRIRPFLMLSASMGLATAQRILKYHAVPTGYHWQQTPAGMQLLRGDVLVLEVVDTTAPSPAA